MNILYVLLTDSMLLTSFIAQLVKNPPAILETWGLVPRLGRSPREGNSTYSSILALEIPWTEEPGGLQSMGP